jgi:hypothetical protein
MVKRGKRDFKGFGIPNISTKENLYNDQGIILCVIELDRRGTEADCKLFFLP